MEPRLQDIEAVYHAALDKEPGPDRDAFVKLTCGDNKALYAQVTALLETSEEAGDFLDRPAFCPDDMSLDGLTPTEGPGSIIGSYRLLEKIGEGGMAVVHMAAQERPLRRRVALKVIKLGMDTKQVMARFDAERQVLAMMDHPNIARVFDAGATETGRPYFVMELVRGLSIIEYCDRNKLSTQERLGLFVPVCNAVHHAHQKGVIHRDLKPSNIMVTMHDGQPVPKVIDFGIAKATNQRVTEHTIFTRYAEMIGTPEYMSPEQAEMSELDIDTRTDIYSLGIVLYELLTGTLPFDAEALRSAAIGEIQRIIREEEPPRPSTRLSTLGKTAEKIAACRGTNATELARRLNRELEWIPMKAMRKDRTRRYRSASEFADDIRNYLAGEPLIAGPESNWYRLIKLMNKHRIALVATTAVVLSLVIGLAVSSHLFVKANRAIRDLSQLEARVASDEVFASVQVLRARGRYEDGLKALEPHLETRYLGSKAQLLYAQLLFDMGKLPDARNRLEKLTSAPPAVAGSAHYLLARIALQSDPTQAEKHRQLAESLLPQTVEAYALRAMMAVGAEEALEWLSKALDLDPAHYASRRARALAHYHLKEYSAMAEDVGAMIALRPDDYLGYALRAIVRREAGEFEMAIEDHDRAMKRCSVAEEMGSLYHQRWQTLMRSGAYQAALVDAKHYDSLIPRDYRRGRFLVFYSLLALEDYRAADEEYRHIIRQQDWAQHYFKHSAARYASECVEDVRRIQFPPELADKFPFYILEQASGFYRLLQERAQRIDIPLGDWIGSLSPDAKYIASSHGYGNSWRTGTLREAVLGRSAGGIEILEIDTGKTRMLCPDGEWPVWSPDGQSIAFHKFEGEKQEIWLIPSQGGVPRRIASGLMLDWSEDSRLLYYWGQSGTTIYAADLSLPGIEDVPVMECAEDYRARSQLSPDNRHIAVNDIGDVRMLTFPEGREVARWRKPWPLKWVDVIWLPDGNSILMNSWWYFGDMGLCILNIETNEATHIFNLDGPKCNILLSRDGSKLMLVLQGLYRECWLLDIDLSTSLAEILAPALTNEQFLVYQLEQYDRIIKADAGNANHYLSRALAHLAGHDAERARQDIKQCGDLMQDVNDPAVSNLIWWASQYQQSKRYDEAESLALCLAELAERFPEHFKDRSQRQTHPFLQLVEIYTACGDQQQAIVWQQKWRHIQDISAK